MAQKNYRLCVSCRKVLHRDQLWRVVRTFDNQQVQLDVGMGRSAYLCPNAHCLQTAQKKNRLSRMLRSPIPPKIFDTLESRLSSAIPHCDLHSPPPRQP